jgi:hypothetical protein
VAAAWRMQRVLQEHVGGSQLVDDSEIAGRTPEIREPAADDGLIVFALMLNAVDRVRVQRRP